MVQPRPRGRRARQPAPRRLARLGRAPLTRRTARILVVCTGNICRSPYIERRLRAALADRAVEVRSAGTGAVVGWPMSPESAARLVRAGGDPAGFAARQLSVGMLRRADLVVTAARAHVAFATALAPEAAARIITLRDLAVVLGIPPPTTTGAPTTPTDDRRPLDDLRTRMALGAPLLCGRSARDADIVDPYQRPARVWDTMAAQVEAALQVVVPAVRAALA